MKMHYAAGLLLAAFALPAISESDYQWTFNNADFTSYDITAVSSTDVFSGTLGAHNPTLNLIIGKRYQVTVVNSSIHPFEVIAKAPTAGSDVILLAMGSITGSFESDPDVNFTDDGAASNRKVEFTLTAALYDAMVVTGHIPGYRCGIHTTTMRGDFNVSGLPIADPIPAPIPLGDITIRLDPVADGLVSPLGVLFPPNAANRMLVFDQVGTVSLYIEGLKLSTPFLDVSSRLVTLMPGYDERGLLGVALHPDFALNGKIYTHTCEPAGPPADFTVPMVAPFDHQGVIAEWQVSASNPNVIDPSTRKELFRVDHPQFNHNGGTIAFGPDHMLYIGFGDGGNADDQGDGHAANGNAQDLTAVLGKLLRIDVDGGGTPSANGQYGIPADNPFAGMQGVLHEIYAFGLRNPYSFSFDTATGDLWMGDVGQNNVEEVDIITAGDNLGWRIKEGSFFFNPNGAGDGFVTDVPFVSPVPPNLVDPVAEYDHDEGKAVIGGFVYHGSAVPDLQDRYVFGDLTTDFVNPSGRLFYLDPSNQINELQIGSPNAPLGLFLKGFSQDPSGEVYVLGSTNIGPSGTAGKVLKIAAAVSPPTAAFTADVTTGMAPLTVQFTDQSIPGTSSITAWAWTFGDGATSSVQNPSHTYNAAGTFTVALTVTTADGSDTETKTDYITVASIPVGPTAAFTADVTTGTVPLMVDFTDESTPGSEPITSWEWDFGDGETSNEQNPTHTYSAPDTYTVTLTVTTSVGGNQATKTNYITINSAGCFGPPKAASAKDSFKGAGGDLTTMAGVVATLLASHWARRRRL